MAEFNNCLALGAIVVDWDKKTLNFHGMNGDHPETTAQEVLNILTDAEAKGLFAYGMIFWRDNNQLCCHDIGGFHEVMVEAGLLEDEEGLSDVD